MTLHSPEEDKYYHVPANKPRHVVFCDEAIGKLIQAAKLISFKVDTPDDLEPMVTVIMRDPAQLVGDAHAYQTFKGQGPTIGHALRGMLDNVNLVFPLGGEYEVQPVVEQRVQDE